MIYHPRIGLSLSARRNTAPKISDDLVSSPTNSLVEKPSFIPRKDYQDYAKTINDENLKTKNDVLSRTTASGFKQFTVKDKALAKSLKQSLSTTRTSR